MTDTHANYSQELAGLKKQLDEMDAKIGVLTTSVRHLTEGNGRQGYYRVLDDIYSPQDKSRSGILERLKNAESRVTNLEEHRKGVLTYLRGIAIGVGIVALDGVLGLDLVGLIRGLL